MSGVFQRLRYWGPLVLWMGVIFWASADSGSGKRGSRILGPLLRWWMPEATSERMDEVIFLIRKGAHVSEYAVLAWLAWRVFLAQRINPGPLGAISTAAVCGSDFPPHLHSECECPFPACGKSLGGPSTLGTLGTAGFASGGFPACCACALGEHPPKRADTPGTHGIAVRSGPGSRPQRCSRTATCA